MIVSPYTIPEAGRPYRHHRSRRAATAIERWYGVAGIVSSATATSSAKTEIKLANKQHLP